MRVIAVLGVVLLVTLPFGFLRAYTRRFTLRWFLAIHVPVVFVFLARFEAHLSYLYIPLTCLAFAAAQLLGAKLGRWWMKRRRIAPLAAEQGTALSRRISNEV